MTQVVSILGSTGSIGRQTLDVIDHLPIRVAALTANRDVARMEEPVPEIPAKTGCHGR